MKRLIYYKRNGYEFRIIERDEARNIAVAVGVKNKAGNLYDVLELSTMGDAEEISERVTFTDERQASEWFKEACKVIA